MPKPAAEMKDCEPAFPQNEFGGICRENGMLAPEHGMSKRFYAACAAMRGLMLDLSEARATAKESQKDIYSTVAELAFAFADALIEEEGKV